MKIIYLLCVLLLPISAFAQLSLGTASAPRTSTMLDVVSTNKGVSFPNVSLASVTDAAIIAPPLWA